MTMNKLNYKILDKDGKVVEDLSFDDYDKLADHMLTMADKYYNGVLTNDNSIEISSFDESGNLIFKDSASFEGSNLEGDKVDEFQQIISDNTDTSGKGFGNTSK